MWLPAVARALRVASHPGLAALPCAARVRVAVVVLAAHGRQGEAAGAARVAAARALALAVHRRLGAVRLARVGVGAAVRAAHGLVAVVAAAAVLG